MPKRPFKPCNVPGCKNLIEHSKKFCLEHEEKERAMRRENNRLRVSSSNRGYDSKWRKYRVRFLRKNPLCVLCKEEGKITPATDVDHVIPVIGPSDSLFWDESNHQALCHSCHSKKTASENGGFGNKKRLPSK